MSMFYKWGGGRAPGFPTVERAYDDYLVTADGREILDAAAGAAVANLGHSVDGVTDAMADQADRLAYVSTAHFTTEPTERLAGKLAAVTPDGLTDAFLVNSGSEAVETALKLARAYHLARGDDRKSTVIGRWQGYHGATLGALSASGNTGRRAPYAPLLKRWPHVAPAYPYRWGYEGTPAEQARAAAGELETLIRQEGPETVAAFVAEPVSGSSIPAAHPHPEYYREVRRICDEHDVLFVADEVMVGFGRTGERFACERFGVTPDLMALGKGISAGYAPLSATMIDGAVAETIEDADAGFGHGHTFSGNPVSAAVGNEIVDRYTDDLLARVRDRGARLDRALEPLTDSPMVGEVRRAGLMLGVEFVADRETKAPFDPDLDVAHRVYDRALADGVYVYPGGGSVDGRRGDHVMLAPPLTVGESAVDRIGEAVVDAVAGVAVELDAAPAAD